jgi:hypothetical protein
MTAIRHGAFYVRLVTLLAALASLAGCAFQSAPAKEFPLEMTDAAGGKAVPRAVAVSIVKSTGWFPYAMMESQQWPMDKIRVEAVRWVDPAKPTLYEPSYLPGAGFVLGLIINEDLEVFVFARGCEPGSPTVRFEGDSSNWGLGEAHKRPGGVCHVQLRQLTKLTPDMLRVDWMQREDARLGVLRQRQMWQQIRGRYAWGMDREAIEYLAACVAENVEYSGRNVSELDDEARDTVQWCRRVSQGNRK